MVQGHWTPYLGCEDGLHSQGKMGPRWTQNPRPHRINLHQGSIQGEYAHLIAFTYAALNVIEVCASDIRNTYLQTPSSQKYYIICGPEFGIENVGKYALVWRAPYGGKSTGKDFHNHLRSCMRNLDFASRPTNPDVWMRPAKHSNGTD